MRLYFIRSINICSSVIYSIRLVVSIIEVILLRIEVAVLIVVS